MSPDEVLAKVKKMGIQTSRSTLLRYERAGLIPEPKRGSEGRGVGRYSDYPEETASYFFAAYYTLKATGFKIQELAQLLPKIGRYDKKLTMQEMRDMLTEMENGGMSVDFRSRIFFENCTNIPDDLKEKAKEVYKLWYGYFADSNKTTGSLIEERSREQDWSRKLEDIAMKATSRQREQIEQLQQENDRLINENTGLREEVKTLIENIETLQNKLAEKGN